MSYPGAKTHAAPLIIGQMPPHDLYVEAFFGSGAVFWMKRRAAASVVIDKEPGLLARANAEAAVSAICGDALELLPQLSLGPGSLVYCDPPYLLETRKGRRYYEHEMSAVDHSRLLALLQELPGRILVSHPPCDLYGAALQGWRCVPYRMRCHGKTMMDALWANFPEPETLHDWRYTGRNFRERLTLKRLAARWLRRLEGMPARKRGYVLQAIASAASARNGAAVLSAANGVGVPNARNAAVLSAANGVAVLLG